MSDRRYSLDDYVDDLRDTMAQTQKDREIISIHSVMNNTDSVTVSLHIYGVHVDHAGRSQYDIEKNLEVPFKVVEQ